ncbi:hypothetical protein [Paenibacillus cremeus]|uniref:Uncharacterized protein n=1 Tax=Paenibacillus cremeus TaxID=2163881 RepID=A0A559KEM3_9BACL|nr:hypothetical protein [Paenibacillus cremeus]TVY10575.1 hypothetical protein FPZ49_07515 [Paenibacillus cremeus]
MQDAEYLERRIEIDGIFEIPLHVTHQSFKMELYKLFRDKGWEFKGATHDITSGRPRGMADETSIH